MLKFESDQGDLQLRADAAGAVISWAHSDLNTRSELLALLAGLSGTGEHFSDLLKQVALSLFAFSGDGKLSASFIELGDGEAGVSLSAKIRSRQARSDLPEYKRVRLFARGNVRHLLTFDEQQNSELTAIDHWPAMPSIELTENHNELIRQSIELSQLKGRP